MPAETPTIIKTLEPTATEEIFLTQVIFPVMTSESCEEIYPDKVLGQVNFGEIIPGKTPVDVAKEVLGNIESQSTSDQLIFSNDKGRIYLNAFVEDDKVISIRSFDIDISAKEMFETYGCPDAVVAYRGGVELITDHFVGVFFEYFENGLSFEYYNFPVTLEEKAVEIVYQEPVDSISSLFARTPKYRDKYRYSFLQLEEVITAENP